MIQVTFSKEASKFFLKLKQSDQDKISRTVEKLTLDPLTGEKLKGELSGKFKIYAWPYRVIYRFDVETKKVRVVTIGHRQGVYKK